MNWKRLYVTCIAAYLSGWPIANGIFNRVMGYMRREAIEAESHEWRDAIADRIAQRVSAELKAERIEAGAR